MRINETRKFNLAAKYGGHPGDQRSIAGNFGYYWMGVRMTNKNDALPVVAWETYAPSKQIGLMVKDVNGIWVNIREVNAVLSHRDAELAELHDVLRRNGFVKCDIGACNCGSYHARYGLPERMAEIKDVLSDAGHPLSNDNGNLVKNALAELVAERDQLQAELAAHGKHRAVKRHVDTSRPPESTVASNDFIRLMPLYAAALVSDKAGAWIDVNDRLPVVPKNGDKECIVAVKRANGKTYVFAASYLNDKELYSEEDGDEEGLLLVTGWRVEMADDEYDTAWHGILEKGDEVTHWQPLPDAPGFEPQARAALNPLAADVAQGGEVERLRVEVKRLEASEGTWYNRCVERTTERDAQTARADAAERVLRKVRAGWYTPRVEVLVAIDGVLAGAQPVAADVVQVPRDALETYLNNSAPNERAIGPESERLYHQSASVLRRALLATRQADGGSV